MNILLLSLLMAFGGQTGGNGTPDSVWSPSDQSSIVSMQGNGVSAKPKKLHTFHVTTDGLLPETVEAKDRLDAITKLGLTIWTEEEWKDCGLICSDPIYARLRSDWFSPEISLHPYPSWRMEAQPMKFDHTFSIGDNKPFKIQNYIGQISQDGKVGYYTPKPEPVDVPAVQEPSKEPPMPDSGELHLGPMASIGIPDQSPIDVPAVRQDRPGLKKDMKGWREWTCSDPSRALEESIDGKLHWCHRMSQ
jgi:hypothetical protein